MRALGPPSGIRAFKVSPFSEHLQVVSNLGLVVMGLAATGVILDVCQPILAPIFLAVVIGLMFGPMADRIEKLGISPWISGSVVVGTFVSLILIAMTAFAVPLSDWSEKVPLIWERIRSELANWQGVLNSISNLQDQMRGMLGSDAQMSVEVNDGSTVSQVAVLAPTILGQILIFLASLYFFIATRHDFRTAVLSLCFNRRMRWRLAHVFRDVENYVSQYLIQITFINFMLGTALAICLATIGVPSAILWGMLAFALNYVIYIGPAIMVILMLGVGLITSDNSIGILLPPGIYLALNMIESQIVTPHLLGRVMMLNPFLIFLSLVFWIWLWGPIGGFVAVPSLLIVGTAIRHFREMYS